jgi:titin
VRPFGIYRLDIAPGATIRATANNALVSAVASQYWGNKSSIGMVSDAPGTLVAVRSSPVAGRVAATLTWRAPSGNGGGAATEYLVDYRVAGTSQWIRVRTTVTSPGTTVTGLVAGKTYEFRVAAKNSAGIGAYAMTQLRVS